MSISQIFWTSWFLTLAPFLIGTFICIGTNLRNAERPSLVSFGFTKIQTLSLSLFIFIIGCIFVSCLSFDFMDNSAIIVQWINHGPKPLSIRVGSSRFFPLHTYEFYFIFKWTSSLYAYYSIPFIQFFIFAFSLQHLLKQIDADNILNTFSIICFGGVILCFTGLVFPESTILLLLPFFYLSVLKWYEKREWLWFFLAGLTAQIMLYYKEPVFTLVAAVSFIGIFRFLRQKQDSKECRPYLEIMLLVLCLIWAALLFYFIPMGQVFLDRKTSNAYSIATFEKIPDVLFSFLYHEPTLILLVFFGICILLFNVHKISKLISTPKGQLMLGLIIGGLGYLSIICVLNLKARWYSSVPFTALALALFCYGSGSARYIKTRTYFVYVFLTLNVLLAVPIISAHLDTMNKTKQLVKAIERHDIKEVEIVVQGKNRSDKKHTRLALKHHLQGKTSLTEENELNTQIVLIDKGHLALQQNGENIFLYDHKVLKILESIMPTFLHKPLKGRYTVYCKRCRLRSYFRKMKSSNHIKGYRQ
jgi:hypothetical protein